MKVAPLRLHRKDGEGNGDVAVEVAVEGAVEGAVNVEQTREHEV